MTGNKNTVYPYRYNSSNGQLTTTQNTEFVTGAASISAIGSTAAQSFIYILDPVGDNIFYYTVGTNGLLQAVNGSPTSNSQSVSGNPIQLTSDSKSKFLYVANAGPSSGIGQPSSDISAYTIAARTAYWRLWGARLSAPDQDHSASSKTPRTSTFILRITTPVR